MMDTPARTAEVRTDLNTTALDDLPKIGEPTAIVIFGASGDLAERKLLPALYNLAARRLLDERSRIIGVARTEFTDEKFRARFKQAIDEYSRLPFDSDIFEHLARRVHFVTMPRSDADAFKPLADRLHELHGDTAEPHNRLFYLAIPPAAFGPTVRGLKASGLAEESEAAGFARIIVEKPFGSDLQSAIELNNRIAHAFREDQIYRIDHYLGKETVQNVLVFRLANGIFEPLWNRRYIDHVQITVAETLGVEDRAAYFDHAGIARDMLQSHILQLLTLIAMEPPVAFEADAVHIEKVKVLRSIRPQSLEELRHNSVRAQYTAGAVGGQPVVGYREEPGVDSESMTETFIGVKLELDNWRWAGVPFYIRTGKRLPKKGTEVAIVFRKPPFALFRRAEMPQIESNVLAIRIQPDEGISLKFASKVPGYDFHVDPVQMEFLYSRAFGIEPPEAYERLLVDAIVGDSTLFARIDEVKFGWELVDQMRACWGDDEGIPLRDYAAGSWGPEQADAIIRRDGRAWRRI